MIILYSRQWSLDKKPYTMYLNFQYFDYYFKYALSIHEIIKLSVLIILKM